MKKELNKILSTEKTNGVNYDDFMALVNIAKEILPCEGTNKSMVQNTWFNYRLNNMEQNKYRYNPTLFHGFDEVVGENNIIECIEGGGVFGTFHYGAYRYVPSIINDYIKDRSSSLDIVVDRESYESEKELDEWNKIRKENDVNYIVSEDYGSGLKLLRILKKRGNILLYLDGNTGSGNDSVPSVCRHITSVTQMRSGIYRLASLLKRKICIVIADQPEPGVNRLVAYKPFAIEKNSLDEGVERAYSYFRCSLKQNPALWRFWYRYHNYVEKWDHVCANFDPEVDWMNQEHGLGVDLRTGKLYEIETV
jgi:hypothetical protein